MKQIIILGDGMADEAIDSLGHLTPLQYAKTPYMDLLASLGVTGRLKTVPEGFHPGSEVANLSVLGYDLTKIYEGRGVLEAASIGVHLQEGELAMRCNLIAIEGEKLVNHSADHITTEESEILIEHLNKHMGSERLIFHTGVSYRHLLVMKGGDKRLACTPPHDIPLHPFRPAMIRAMVAEAEETADFLNRMILRSQELLSDHPINKARVAAGKSPANSIWPWSPGYRPAMKSLETLYEFKRSAVIAAVDLIRGIGAYAGMEIIPLKEATGLYNTNYEEKAQAAIEALKSHDFVFLHIEASDEAGHEGDVALKVRTIEYLDRRIVGPIYQEISCWDEPVTIAILPDHPTPCALRTHTNAPIPFLIYRRGITPDTVKTYDELSVKKGKYPLLEHGRLIETMLQCTKK